jgi:hypothetical protein
MDELPAHQEHYTDKRIKHAQLFWGSGFFSPGGPEEVARTVENVDTAGEAMKTRSSPLNIHARKALQTYRF